MFGIVDALFQFVVFVFSFLCSIFWVGFALTHISSSECLFCSFRNSLRLNLWIWLCLGVLIYIIYGMNFIFLKFIGM